MCVLVYTVAGNDKKVLVNVSSKSFDPGLSGWKGVTDVLYISLPCFNFITMIFVYIFGINKNIHSLHRSLMICLMFVVSFFF